MFMHTLHICWRQHMRVVSLMPKGAPALLPVSPLCVTPLCHPRARLAALSTDGQAAAWFPVFPVLPLNPPFSNLNTMFVFTSAFHFCLALIFVALLKLKWRPADLWELSGGDGKGVWDALRNSAEKHRPRTPGAALKSWLLFGYLTRTGLLNWLKV